MNRLALFAGFVVAFATSPLAGPAAAQEAHTVGVSLGLTGVQAAAAQRQIKGIELAVEKINQKGGVHGRPLKLIVEDDQTKPDIAVTKVNKLIDQDRVLAVVGGNSGDTAMAIGTIVEKKQVALLSTTGFNGTEAQKNFKYSFLMIPTYEDSVDGLVKYTVDKLACRKVGLLRLTRLWGVQASNAYKASGQKYGLTIVREETLADADKDMTPQLTNIKAAGPCAVAIWAAVPAAAISIKNARQLGIEVPLIGNPVFAAATTPEIAGEAAEGAIASATLVASDPLARQKEYAESFQAKYNLAADMWDAAAYDAVHLVAHAIAQLPPGQVNAKSVRDQLAAIKGYEGSSSIVDFTRHHWPLSESWVLVTIKGGKAIRLAN
jgi:branched-chain amino acid transport system substrate-binding protein